MDPDGGQAGERLGKVLAHAGVTSRRGAEDLIRAGRVSVNGRTITEPATRVDPARDQVRLDGRPVGRAEAHVHVALHKPRHVMSTTSDPQGRRTVTQLVDLPARLYPAGRLDFESEGLLVLTNDGDLAMRLTHPRYGHEREYRVKISGTPTPNALAVWREGIYLEDGRTRPADVRIESSTGSGTWLRVVLREGRQRQVRRMMEAMHHTVHRLIRVRIGPLALGNLAPGAWRYLSPAEVAWLRGETPPSDPARPRVPRYLPGWARPRPRPRARGRRT